ncbi:MAG: hypothetical protein B7733_02285 [Myxococcales bacterium FL481]|nr:MAG: hypothetical protein B7733_02285 [Myxococcales bacterium FL481]
MAAWLGGFKPRFVHRPAAGSTTQLVGSGGPSATLADTAAGPRARPPGLLLLRLDARASTMLAVHDPEGQADPMSSHADTPRRLALPLRLHDHLASVGKWMRLLGIAQAVGSIGGLFIAAFVSMTLVTAGAGVAALVFAATGLLLALGLRQALLLLAASDHFVDSLVEPNEAHEHLVLAFERLRPVFVIDAGIALCALVALLSRGVL